MVPLKVISQNTNREPGSLAKYFNDIRNEKLITAEEEAILAQKVKLGDEKAMEILIRANLRFVVAVAKQFQNRGLPLVDLINEGNIGLIKAVKLFDETRGFKLITYAIWWIRATIRHAINEQKMQVRLPYHKSALLNKVSRANTKMEQELQRQPSCAEIAEEIRLSVKVVADNLQTSRREVSLEAPFNQAENLTLADTLEDTGGVNAEQLLIHKSFKAAIESALDTLPTNQAFILRLFYGLGDKQPLSLDEIGIQCGLAKDRVRDLKDKAIFTLKHSSRFSHLKEYLR